MKYEHGNVGLKALVVRETSLEAYRNYVQEYVPLMCGKGDLEITCDTERDWMLWSPKGRINPKDPPPRTEIRFIHKVTVKHRWTPPNAEEGASQKEDEHIFYFDATDACPDDWKEHLEQSAGFEREATS